MHRGRGNDGSGGHRGGRHGDYGDGDRGHWGRGRGRAFEYGRLRFVLLQLIADKPSHGYELIKAIEASTDGSYSPSPGVIYPTLAMLEDTGCVAAGASDDNRRLYKITPAGRKFLAENRAIVDEVFGRMKAAAAQRAGSESPQVVRAIHNLRTALRLRLESPLSATQVQALAAALDATAATIEQL